MHMYTHIPTVHCSYTPALWLLTVSASCPVFFSTTQLFISPFEWVCLFHSASIRAGGGGRKCEAGREDPILPVLLSLNCCNLTEARRNCVWMRCAWVCVFVWDCLCQPARGNIGYRDTKADCLARCTNTHTLTQHTHTHTHTHTYLHTGEHFSHSVRAQNESLLFTQSEM